MTATKMPQFRVPYTTSNGLVGERFGLLTVVERAGNQGNNARWLCRCDCGKTCHKTTQRLRETRKAGGKSSCGCHASALSRQHGMLVKVRVEAARAAKRADSTSKASVEVAALDLASCFGMLGAPPPTLTLEDAP